MTLVEELAGIGWHRFLRVEAALWTDQHGFEDDVHDQVDFTAYIRFTIRVNSPLSISRSRSSAPPINTPLTNTIGKVGHPVHIFKALRRRQLSSSSHIRDTCTVCPPRQAPSVLSSGWGFCFMPTTTTLVRGYRGLHFADDVQHRDRRWSPGSRDEYVLRWRMLRGMISYSSTGLRFRPGQRLAQLGRFRLTWINTTFHRSGCLLLRSIAYTRGKRRMAWLTLSGGRGP